MSSKKWLAIHGLATNKLTILDALAPTFIPHKPKFIPILNKHVLSKVFDDVSLKLNVLLIYLTCNTLLSINQVKAPLMALS